AGAAGVAPRLAHRAAAVVANARRALAVVARAAVFSAAPRRPGAQDTAGWRRPRARLGPRARAADVAAGTLPRAASVGALPAVRGGERWLHDRRVRTAPDR